MAQQMYIKLRPPTTVNAYNILRIIDYEFQYVQAKFIESITVKPLI